MDAALNIDQLREALGSHPLMDHVADGQEAGAEGTRPAVAGWEPALPTAEELQRLLGDAETRLFLARRDIPNSLVRLAWYLHGIASADAAVARYTVARQRRAFAVSAHIFDLTTLSEERAFADRLRFGFAAEVGYHRSEAEPNAMAISRRLESLVRIDLDLLDHLPTLATEAGVALLGLRSARLPPILGVWRGQFRALATQIGVEDLSRTMFGPTFCVVEGADALVRFLVRGDRDQLARARERFTTAVTVPEGRGDEDARWVAAHLRYLADDMDAGSVWTLLPPSIPDSAKQAFTVARPPVLTLWPPQRELLAPVPGVVDDGHQGVVGQPSALDPSVRRLVLSVPTSSGKTLLAEIVMISHLATASTGVCYVTPLRSLGREVRRSLARRLRVLAREVAPEEPDFGIPPDSEFAATLATLGFTPADLVAVADPARSEPDVAVMTPERLAHALRDDPAALLDRFGLFVFDEAHLVGEPGRGFLLESTLAFLHWRTRDTAHRLLLLSAAMGNSGQLVAWLNVDGGARLLESDWRGPRRLHAIFSTEIDWNRPTVEPVSGRAKHPLRLRYPTFGQIRLRPAEHHGVTVRTTEPIGVTTFAADAAHNRVGGRLAEQSTPLYRMLAHIVGWVAHAGPVLVIRSTRRDAVSMAEAIADGLDDLPAARPLVELARTRLGADHPLPSLLAKGVAYHHAGLPVEIQEAIEDGVREDVLRFVVATSTLTEGVNLPVRTVVLAALPYRDQPANQQLSGARLVNAMGRAGRATKESEGWVILARAARPTTADFASLEPDEADLQVRSRLVDADALDALAAFEDASRAGEDAIVAARGVVADFVAYIWFILAAEEELGRVAQEADPIGAFAATLAYAQLQPEDRERFARVVGRVSDAYSAESPERRRRWARTGTSVATAQVLERIADEIVAAVTGLSEAEIEAAGTAAGTLALLDRLGVVPRLLGLAEAPRRWAFHRTESSRSDTVNLEAVELLRHWLSGQPLAQMADELLAEIPERALRIERLVDGISDFCEHYLAWMLGVLLEQVNRRLLGAGSTDRTVSIELPVFVRYGVSSVVAVELLLSGLRSRELATRLASAAEHEGIEVRDLRDWLGRMSLGAWRLRFDATATDLLDLLEYGRKRDVRVLRTLLGEGVVTVGVETTGGTGVGGVVPPVDDAGPAATVGGVPVLVRTLARAPAPAPLVLFPAATLGSAPIGTIPTSIHAEVQALLDTGLDINASLDGDQLTLRLTRE